jgi:Tol biopolymer transport system component
MKYIFLFILFLLLLYPLSTFSALPPFWTDSQTMSLGQNISTEADVCSYEDNIYVVWSDNRTGNYEIFFRSSEDAGLTWGREERLTDTLDESSQPAIACDSKNVYVVWREKSDNVSQIFYKVWDGNLWSDNILISGDQGNARRPDITTTTIVPNSYLYIVWENTNLVPPSNGRTDQNKITAYLIRSTDGGRTFSQTKPLTEGAWNNKEPAIWGGVRDAYIVWVDDREGSWNVFFKRLDEAQNGAEAKLSSVADCSSPSINGAEPRIYATWQCVEEGFVYNDIYVSRSSDHGVTWSGANKLTKSEAEAVFPRVTASISGDLNSPQSWFFWQDGRNGEWNIFFSTEEADNTNPDSLPIVISDKPSILPDVVATNGQIHLFWTKIESDSRSKILCMRRDTLPPKRPETPVHFDLTANPGYDDDKNITFSWKSSEPIGTAKYNVYASVDNGEFTLVGSTNRTTYDLIGESGKVYRIYIEAVDTVGNVSVPSGISQKIISDPDPPEVIIHSPGSNSIVRGNVPITISVNDDNLLESDLEYGISSFPSEWESLAGPFYKNMDRILIMTWDTKNLDGKYTIRLTATDKAGNESKAEAMIDIDSSSPIAISSGEFTELTPSDVDWNYGTPAWSPTGDKIAFYSDEGGTEDLWVMSPDGQNRSRLTRSTDIKRHPSWSPSGNMLVYESLPAINKSQPSKPEQWKLWLIGSDGKNARQITSGDGSDTNPSWSPDGSAIAFDSNVDGNYNIRLITNINKVITGASPQYAKLTDSRWDNRNPEWSPDGSKIIFQSNGKGSWDIMEIGVDGTNLNTVVATQSDEIDPDWSSDGKWILYSTNEPETHYEIRAINLPERSEQIILSSPDSDAHNAQWSPKMDVIVYESQNSLFTADITHPVSNLEAMISLPRGGEILTGKVDIKGIARGKDFVNYKLQFSDPNLSSYPLTGESTSQVTEEGFLGKWDTGELEGRYLLKLMVTGKNGQYAEDSVWVTVSNRLPFIVVDEPKDNFVTSESIVTVKGHAEPQSTVTINGTTVKLDSNGIFSQKIQLTDGTNKITVKVYNGLDNGSYTVERTVILDTKPPELSMESPIDFQVVKVPYVTVKGKVNKKAEVSILSTRVWTDDNGNFQRNISIKEGLNLILISASDQFGHYTSIQRRVIFLRETKIVSDNGLPGITDVYPENLAVITGKSLQVSATLIDDFGIDPFKVAFWFDNEEIKDYELDIGTLKEDQVISIDQYPVIHFNYNPELSISDGIHSFKLQIKDTSGNLAESSFSFSVDTVPPEVLVSAFLNDTQDKIRIVAVANKTLSEIGSVSVFPQEGAGYSITKLTPKDGYYEAFFDVSPSQKNLILNFIANTYLDKEVISQGYLAWNNIRSDERVKLGTDNYAKFISDPINVRTGKLAVILRSLDGLDANTLNLYSSDAEFRRLKLSGLAYVLSASQESDIQGILSLPISSQQKNLVMFKWDDKQKQWQPLDRIVMTDSLLSSKIIGTGTYALYSDVDPPLIRNISPKDSKEVPLERFFVEANITDIGSGVSEIKLLVDGKKYDYDYDSTTGLFTYFPSEIEWGLHKIDITAIDRAGNVSVFSSSFLTREIFQFISVSAYPNPAKDNVSIDFKLTRSADVTLRIFTISGELVYDTKKDSIARSIFSWRCRNNSGNKVASGIYIYVIEANIYQTTIQKYGKIAIIR